ncbi:MAG: 3-deoxy-7-phosphoheptulonate synthase [Neisseriales bacterium]|nr:MAG: 3-deoxy-7-phosphoheptulonate synthase [Neisseriales bacterium]
MAYQTIKKVPTSEEIISKIPLTENGYKNIERHKEEIEAILSGEDSRLLMIVGPCSAWPSEAVLDYANRLQQISEEVKDQIKIIMRVYIQKPRTVKGWTGPINQPDPLAEPDIEAGIWYCRKLMTQVVELGLPIADECLFTHNARGFQELLSWVAIGARSTEDQEHRIFASSLDCPVGMKNPTHGSLKIAVNSIVAAQHSHYAVFDGYEVKTAGNKYAHLVLRGSNDKPNYSVEHIDEVAGHFAKGGVVNPAIIVDVSHDNCLINGVKDHNAQAIIVKNVIDSLGDKPELKKLVKGFMLESFIKEGRQNAESGDPIDLGGLSITDPCLSWDTTKDLLLSVASKLRA